MSSAPFLRYSPSIERPTDDEHVVFDELSRTLQHITRSMAARYRHAYRPVHAKSHGVLAGTLTVLSDLAPELAQGLFAQPASYGAILRFSTNPGDMLADNVSSPRGLAVKILAVPGETISAPAGRAAQDFVCVDAKTFSAPDPAGFLKSLKMLDKTLHLPEEVKHAVSVTARAANATLGLVGAHSAALESLGAPAVHILGHTFTTVVPVRYGEYVGKIGFTPASENLLALIDQSVDLGDDYNALENLIHKFFRTETAVWSVQVQLALATADGSVDEEHFPIEKADVPWPEPKPDQTEADTAHPVSPWQTVATLTVGPQESYSDDRQLYVDERLSFNPWHALVAHQPLGQIMRARRKAYAEATKFRMQRNGREVAEPQSAEEVPA